MAIGIGSNLGDRRGRLGLARERLARCLGGLDCSRIYETEPRDVVDQPRFLNACCVGESRLPARQLLTYLRETERLAGRRPGRRFGPRALDLDLLLYDDRIIDEPDLRVPHPRMSARAFVLLPLAEVAADWVHPELEVTVGELASIVSRRGVRPLEDGWGAYGGPEWSG